MAIGPAGASGKTTGLMAEPRSSTSRRPPFSSGVLADLAHQLALVLDAGQVGGVARPFQVDDQTVRTGQGEVVEIGALLMSSTTRVLSGDGHTRTLLS